MDKQDYIEQLRQKMLAGNKEDSFTGCECKLVIEELLSNINPWLWDTEE